MSEEEIITEIEEIIEYSKLTTDIGIADQTYKIQALEGVLDLYTKANKVIDLMAEHIFKNSNNLAEYFCNGIPENICEARGNTEEGCRYCIKLYFNKQVEEEDE